MNCHNCDAPLGDPPGNFCPQCGQDTANHPPTFWEFVHEFVTHYVALEGKLWRTLYLLFLKPAELTREYRAGRKQRYISPLRLYITASFLFFLVIKVAGWGNAVYVETTTTTEPDKSGGSPGLTVKTIKPVGELTLDDLGQLKNKDEGKSDGKDADSDSSAKPTLPCKPEDKACATIRDRIDDTNKKLREKLGGAGKKMGDFTLDDLKSQGNANFHCDAGATICNFLVPHLEKKYKGKNMQDVMEMMKAGMMADIPYALFMLLPLFALMTKLIYLNRGLYFGEHVVYALHVHAFTFFMLLVKAMLPRIAGDIVLLGALVYYFVAMQRFFGGRWWATLLRYGVVGTAYPILLSLVATAVALFVFLA